MSTSILYVEDEAGFRSSLSNDYGNCKTIHFPQNSHQCQDMIASNAFTHAFLDNNLEGWFDSESPIMVDEQQVLSGVGIAGYLLEKNVDIKIIMYSAHHDKLLQELENAGISDKVELITYARHRDLFRKIKSNLDSIITKDKIQLKVKIAEKRGGTDVPGEVAMFFAKIINKSLNAGNSIWQYGDFGWVIDVNVVEENEVKKVMKADYIVELDAIDFYVFSISDLKADNVIDINQVKNAAVGNTMSRLMHSINGNPVFEYFVVQELCNLFMRGNLAVDVFISSLEDIGSFAKFFSQKELFKALSYSTNYNSNEEIYKELQTFTNSGFPKILQIYNGRVEGQNGDFALVKLESISPEEEVRLERFRSALLNQYGLTTDATFEYCIYSPDIGGNAFYIEPT